MKKFYITTAIDYVNAPLHIGHAYEKIAADAIARYKRFCEYDTFFLIGNDENSLNAERKARELGIDPQLYCDKMAKENQNLWKKLNIAYDRFIRTTEDGHKRVCRELFLRAYQKGDIYKGKYEGWYCISCEAFYQASDLVDGKCPTHKSEAQWLEEENYFFALSRYQDRLLKHIEEHPEFIEPEIRRNEIVSFIKQGLQDFSVSRASVKWGIPTPVDPDQVTYVWYDALINYLSGISYLENPAFFQRYWPADVHVIGKDITRFHAIYWPAMLMSAGIPLPKTVFGHGFVNFKGEKMSKSLGNVVDPLDVIDRFGPDPLRYFLLREVPFGQDGDFTWERFIDRYNSDLANDLGNLLSRVITMIKRYSDGKVPKPSSSQPDRVLKEKAQETLAQVEASMETYQLLSALGAIWELVRESNRYIEVKAPWILAKNPARQDELNLVLYDLAESLRFISLLIYPFIPGKAEEIWRQLGFSEDIKEQRIDALKTWGKTEPDQELKGGAALFPRIEKGEEEHRKAQMRTETVTEKSNERVSISDFRKLDIRVATIVAVEKIPKADKLLKLQIDIGYEKRQLVAGIAEHYSPENLIGQKIVVITNLEPAEIRGVRSEGMLLAAEDGAVLSLLTPDREVGAGSKVR